MIQTTLDSKAGQPESNENRDLEMLYPDRGGYVVMDRGTKEFFLQEVDGTLSPLTLHDDYGEFLSTEPDGTNDFDVPLDLDAEMGDPSPIGEVEGNVRYTVAELITPMPSDPS